MNAADLGVFGFWISFLGGALSAWFSLWAFFRWTDAAAVRSSFNRLVAHLFEFRLFSDEPSLILRAQRDLIVANGLFLQQLLRPTLALMIPLALLLVVLDAYLASAPLRPGEPAVVTVQYRGNAVLPPSVLTSPPGIEVDSRPVRVPRDHQIYWRVRPLRRVSGALRVSTDGRVISKRITAEPGPHWIADQRASGMLFLTHPLELPFSDPLISSIAISYPRATIFQHHWLVWFSGGSLLMAAALFIFPARFRKRLLIA